MLPKSFFGCMTTKSGVKIISILTLAVYVFYLAALGLYGSLYGLDTTVDTTNESNATKTTDPDLESNEGISNAAINYGIQAMSTYYMGMVISYSHDYFILVLISLIVCIVGITLNVMLLFGSENNRWFFMLPWLIMTMIHLLVCLMNAH